MSRLLIHPFTKKGILEMRRSEAVGCCSAHEVTERFKLARPKAQYSTEGTPERAAAGSCRSSSLIPRVSRPVIPSGRPRNSVLWQGDDLQSGPGDLDVKVYGFPTRDDDPRPM